MAWVIDLDGVMWRGDQPLPGAAEAVDRLAAAGHEVAYVTNNSAVPAAEVEHRLDQMGVDAAGRVITSAQAASSLLEAGQRVLVRGGPGVRLAVEAAGATVVEASPADVVLVGWHRDFTYDTLAEAHRAITGGARFVATNDDASYPVAGEEIPGGGAIVAYLERSTGVEPVIAGKPHQPVADLIGRRMGGDGWVVGDRPETDGLLARRLGWRFGLVLSGVAEAGDRHAVEPHATATDLLALVTDVLDGLGQG